MPDIERRPGDARGRSRATAWRGIVAIRSELNLEDANVMAIPASMLAWIIDG